MWFAIVIIIANQMIAGTHSLDDDFNLQTWEDNPDAKILSDVVNTPIRCFPINLCVRVGQDPPNYAITSVNKQTKSTADGKTISQVVVTIDVTNSSEVVLKNDKNQGNPNAAETNTVLNSEIKYAEYGQTKDAKRNDEFQIYSQDVNHYTSKIMKLESRIFELKSKAEYFKRHCLNTEKMFKLCENDREKLVKANEKCIGTANSCLMQNRKLEIQTDNLKKLHDNCSSGLQQMTQNYQNIFNENKNLTKERDGCKLELKGQENSNNFSRGVEDFRQKYESLLLQNQEIKSKLAANNEACDNRVQQLTNLKISQNSTLETLHKNCINELNILKQKHDSKESIKLHGDFNACNTELEELKTRFKTLDDTNMKNKELYENCNNKLELVHQSPDNRDNNGTDLTDIEACLNDLKLLRTKYESIANENEQIFKSSNDFENKYDICSFAIQDLTKQKGDSDMIISNIYKMYQGCTSDLKYCQQKYESSIKENQRREEYENTIKVLNLELEELKSEQNNIDKMYKTCSSGLTISKQNYENCDREKQDIAMDRDHAVNKHKVCNIELEGLKIEKLKYNILKQNLDNFSEKEKQETLTHDNIFTSQGYISQKDSFQRRSLNNPQDSETKEEILNNSHDASNLNVWKNKYQLCAKENHELITVRDECFKNKDRSDLTVESLRIQAQSFENTISKLKELYMACTVDLGLKTRNFGSYSKEIDDKKLIDIQIENNTEGNEKFHELQGIFENSNITESQLLLRNCLVSKYIVDKSLDSCNLKTTLLLAQLEDLRCKYAQCNRDAYECEANRKTDQWNLKTSSENLDAVKEQVDQFWQELAAFKVSLQNEKSESLIADTKSDDLAEIASKCWKAVDGADLSNLFMSGDENVYFLPPIFEKKSWFEAAEFCQANGMQLVSPKSDTQQRAIDHLIFSVYTPQMPVQVWSDITSLSTSNYSHFNSGSGMTFTNWGGAESSRSPSRCVLMSMQANNETVWHDEDCSSKRQWMCQANELCKELLLRDLKDHKVPL